MNLETAAASGRCGFFVSKRRMASAPDFNIMEVADPPHRKNFSAYCLKGKIAAKILTDRIQIHKFFGA